ncbi:MAG: helix-turn-helix domain-containing protein [Bacillota bacterium]|nr:helix-turn-helix domain-containing protein [Bacillota bacterium]
MEKDISFPGPPWSWQPSLEAMVEEVGIDFDAFLASLKNGATDGEMAAKFGVSQKTIGLLRHHFERFGIDSIMGQD